MKGITLEKLLEAGAHLGHQAKKWNPKMSRYLYGVKDGVSVFDLAKTKEALEVALDVLPDMLFVVDTHNEIGAVKEANRLKIPVVGIVDSNADPDMVEYPIPMNDDATSAVEYVLDLVGEAVK